MFKKLSLIGAIAAALPLAATAATTTFTTGLQGWAGSSQVAGGAQATTGMVETNLTAVVTVSALPSSTTLDPVGPNTIVLNGTLQNTNPATPLFAQYTWTFTNATYNITAGPGYDLGFYMGPGGALGACPAGGYCLDAGWNTNPVGGASTGGGTTLNPAVDTFGSLQTAGYQFTSALTLASGTVTCVTALMGACSATVNGTTWDAFSIKETMNFMTSPVSVAGGDLVLMMMGDSSVFSLSTVAAPVPVPAAAWLLAPAVLAAGRFARRRRAA